MSAVMITCVESEANRNLKNASGLQSESDFINHRHVAQMSSMNYLKFKICKVATTGTLSTLSSGWIFHIMEN